MLVTLHRLFGSFLVIQKIVFNKPCFGSHGVQIISFVVFYRVSDRSFIQLNNVEEQVSVSPTQRDEPGEEISSKRRDFAFFIQPKYVCGEYLVGIQIILNCMRTYS